MSTNAVAGTGLLGPRPKPMDVVGKETTHTPRVQPTPSTSERSRRRRRRDRWRQAGRVAIPGTGPGPRPGPGHGHGAATCCRGETNPVPSRVLDVDAAEGAGRAPLGEGDADSPRLRGDRRGVGDGPHDRDDRPCESDERLHVSSPGSRSGWQRIILGRRGDERALSRSVATLAPTTSTWDRPGAADLQKRWWGGWGSNPRPKDYESSALTG